MYQQVELIKSMPKVMPKGFPWDEDPSSQEFMLSSLPQAHNILTKFLKDNKLSGDYEFRMPGKLTFENGQIINNYTTKYIEYEDLPEVYKEYTSFMYDFEDLIEWNLKNLKPSHLEGAFPMANYFYKAVNGKVVAKTPDEILEYANAKIAAAATQKEKDEINNFVRNIGTIYRLYIDRDVSSALKRFKDGSIDKPVFDLADPNDPYYIVKTKLK
jgi:hypothetical protein